MGVNLNLMQTGDDFSSGVTVNKVLRKLKMLSKDVQLPIASDETDEGDGSVRDIIDPR